MKYQKIYIILGMNLILAIATTIGMTIIPVLVTDSLGLSLLILGIIEGTTEFISNALRLTIGILFDKIKNKKTYFYVSYIASLHIKSYFINAMLFNCISSKNYRANI